MRPFNTMHQPLLRLIACSLFLGLIVGEVQSAGLGERLRNRRRRQRCCCGSSSTTRAGLAGKRVENAWTPLFDGKTLGKWKVTKFGGEGPVTIKDGALHMGFGNSLSGVTYHGEVPKTDYEVRLEAMKVDGIDFFCGLTFPVDDAHCSFIVGGWAGGIVGLSSIDGFDASENDTTLYMTFKKAQWYKIRVRVRSHHIQAWIDDKMVVDQDIKDRKLSTRPEVDLSKPFGISAYETRAALRNIQIRPLTEAEKKKP